MTENLAIERDPVLVNMTRGEVETSYFGVIRDLAKDVNWVSQRVALDQSRTSKGISTKLDEYIHAADQLTVILRLVDRARDHALELSVRPVEDEVVQNSPRVDEVVDSPPGIGHAVRRYVFGNDEVGTDA
jgi:hypothetical protein